MSRTKSLTSIEKAIDKTKKMLTKTQNQYDKLAEKLKGLQKEKESFEAQKIMNAFKKSKRTMRELMTFLNA